MADPAVAAGLVVAEAMRKGLSQLAAALEFQTHKVGSIAQKKMRKSARSIALELTRGYRVRLNPADSRVLSPMREPAGRRMVWQGLIFLPCLNVRATDPLLHGRNARLGCKPCQMLV
ncbi:hypothetical protein ACM43_14230 [Bradyrhizobium sp. CCBAU 45321]|nr:hypothetical protein [Bradyrhizobium sp. CCBAU 45321]